MWNFMSREDVLNMRTGLVAGMIGLVLGGCAEGIGAKPGKVIAIDGDAAPFIPGRFPLPGGAKINHEQSLIIGDGDDWMGRVRIDTGQSSGAAYAFFLKQFSRDGWASIVSVRGKSSLLVFTKLNRSITIEISEGTMFEGASVTISAASRNAVSPSQAKP